MPESFFYLRTNKPPKIITYIHVDASKALEGICKAYSIDLKYSLSHQIVNLENLNRNDASLIVQITENIMLSLAMHGTDLMLSHTENVTSSEIKAIKKIIKKFTKKKTLNSLYLLVYEMEMGGFRLNEFKLPETEFDIASHYNDDFLSINQLIQHRLTEDKSKGIVLLHGQPGTGKTSYVRHLIRTINKKLIYIPTNLAHRLGDPDFLPFLVDQKDSILIIEDAEAKQRQLDLVNKHSFIKMS